MPKHIFPRVGYDYPNYCPECKIEFRILWHPFEDRGYCMAMYCPVCGKSVICEKCYKPLFECKCKGIEKG